MEPTKELAEWLIKVHQQIRTLPTEPLPSCDEVLFNAMMCCGWHTGLVTMHNFLDKVARILVPLEELLAADAGENVMTNAYFAVLCKKFDLPIYVPYMRPQE